GADGASAEAAHIHDGLKGHIFTRESEVYQALEGKSADERKAILGAYQRMYGALDQDLSDEMGGVELDRARALAAGDQTGADAARVKIAMDGFFGADAKEIQ